MDANKINSAERDRLKCLIEKEEDYHNKQGLIDDLTKLEESPKEYWNYFDVKAYQPGTIIETQRLNTIILMQQFYTEN